MAFARRWCLANRYLTKINVPNLFTFLIPESDDRKWPVSNESCPSHSAEEGQTRREKYIHTYTTYNIYRQQPARSALAIPGHTRRPSFVLLVNKRSCISDRRTRTVPRVWLVNTGTTADKFIHGCPSYLFDYNRRKIGNFILKLRQPRRNANTEYEHVENIN